MVVFISLETRQEPFIIVCSYVVSVQFADKFNATGFCPVEKAAYLRHHDVLHLSVCRGCQSDLGVFNKFYFPQTVLSPTRCEIQETDSGTSRNEIFSSGCPRCNRCSPVVLNA